jgi:iron-sulfur cluster repair protein YtfE (RIC family)
MTTDTTTWPEQIRLPGQTAAHPGPVDMTMMYVMHHAFRRDLSAFAEAAEQTPATDRRAWRSMAARWKTFSFALHHHHSGEDAGLWPALMDRADAEGRTVLEAMEAEHAEIDPILEACAAGFERLAEHADEDARAALAVRLTAARERLGEHLRHEETEAIALIQDLLTQEEWEAIEEEHFSAGISLREILPLVPWALHELPAPVRRDLFARPGGGMHRVMWLLTRRRFAREDAAAFTHVD